MFKHEATEDEAHKVASFNGKFHSENVWKQVDDECSDDGKSHKPRWNRAISESIIITECVVNPLQLP